MAEKAAKKRKHNEPQSTTMNHDERQAKTKNAAKKAGDGEGRLKTRKAAKKTKDVKDSEGQSKIRKTAKKTQLKKKAYTLDDLKKLREKRAELEMDKMLGKNKDTSKLRSNRKQIARVLTYLNSNKPEIKNEKE